MCRGTSERWTTSLPTKARRLPAPPDVVAHLKEANERLASAGLEANLTWMTGDPGRAIVDTAKEIRAHVIVLGEHHHGLWGTSSVPTSTPRCSAKPAAR